MAHGATSISSSPHCHSEHSEESRAPHALLYSHELLSDCYSDSCSVGSRWNHPKHSLNYSRRLDRCRREETMTTKSVFISFDFDHDNDLRGNLVAQAEDSESPFNITDWSLHEPIDENWRREVRNRIRRVDLVIVICGEHTHDAPGVTAELTITREEGKPYFLLKGRRRRTCTKPRSALRTDVIHPWRSETLRRLINESR